MSCGVSFCVLHSSLFRQRFSPGFSAYSFSWCWLQWPEVFNYDSFMMIAFGALRNLGLLLTTSWRHSPSLFPLEALQFSCDIQVFRSPPVNCCVWHKIVGEVYFFPCGHQLVHQHLRFLFPQWMASHLCWKSKRKRVPLSRLIPFCWSRRILFQEHLSCLLQRCGNDSTVSPLTLLFF